MVRSTFGRWTLQKPRRVLLLALLLLTGASAEAQQPAATNAPAPRAWTNSPLRVIQAEVLRTMLQRTNDFVLVDVMPRLYFRDFHIRGAMCIPEAEIAATVRDWPRARRIVLYCLDRECESSRDAARTLLSMGFQDVLQYEGGKREWRQKKYEAVGPGKLLEE